MLFPPLSLLFALITSKSFADVTFCCYKLAKVCGLSVESWSPVLIVAVGPKTAYVFLRISHRIHVRVQTFAETPQLVMPDPFSGASEDARHETWADLASPKAYVLIRKVLRSLNPNNLGEPLGETVVIMT